MAKFDIIIDKGSDGKTVVTLKPAEDEGKKRKRCLYVRSLIIQQLKANPAPQLPLEKVFLVRRHLVQCGDCRAWRNEKEKKNSLPSFAANPKPK